MTYVMAMLIVLGAGLVAGARYLQHRQQAPLAEKREREDMERSTLQFKRELERSGSEIIGKLGDHIERLESLIAEADRRADTLDAALTELHTLSQTVDRQTDELKAAEQDARREQQLVSQLLGELRAAAAGAAAVRTVEAPSPIRRVDADDFTAVLQHSIERDEQRQPVGHAAPPAYHPTAGAIRQAAHLAQAVQSPASLPAAEDAADMPAASASGAPSAEEARQEDSSAARVRALLLAGHAPAQIAKETGVGRGAIELMQEMMRRQLAESDS